MVESLLPKYTVVQPGRVIRQFAKGEDAVKHLIANPGYAMLYTPDGNLVMTKGHPSTD